MWPQRTGITDYIGAPMTPVAWKRNTKLLPAPYQDRLAHETVTLAELLKEAGYATFFAGKWHLGPEGWWPENQGFEHNLGGTDRGGPYGGGRYFSPYANPKLPDGPQGEHLPARLAQETAKFIAAHRDKPFFAYFSFYDVHTPLMAREDLRQKYEAKRTRLNLEENFGKEAERQVRLTQDHAVYAAMVESMDQAIGTVLQKLDELKMADNTVVIFTSDNGGLSTSEGSPTSNLPLRGGKGWLYEGGIREPFIIRWPNHCKAGSVISTPISSPDLMATALEIAQVPAPSTQSADGCSLLPLLQGTPLPERALYWHYPHYGNQGGAPAAAIRRKQWKLIEWYEDQRVELYNLEADLGEQNDLSAKHPEIAQQMLQELHAWQKSVGALMPTTNPKYDPTKPSGRTANEAKKAKPKS
jgi:arylsulfatase A-like enzyme